MMFDKNFDGQLLVNLLVCGQSILLITVGLAALHFNSIMLLPH